MNVDLGVDPGSCAKPRRMLASKLTQDRPTEKTSETPEHNSAQSARFRVRIDALGRVVPEIIPVEPSEEGGERPE